MSDHHTQDVASAAAGADTTGSATPPRRRLRRPGRVAVAVAAFLAGATFSGAGAVWASHQFSDVPSNHRFHGDITWLADNGVTTGYDDATFRPTDPVSRQAMAAFLHRLSDRTVVQETTTDPGSAKVHGAIVSCPAGTRAIAGGGESDVSGLAITESAPVTSPAPGWKVRWDSMDGTALDPDELKVWVTCAPD